MNEIDKQVNKLKEEFRNRKHYFVKDGVLIENIPSGKSVELLRILSLPKDTKVQITINSNEELKDVIVIEDNRIKERDINLVLLISPNISIHFIEEYKVIDEFSVSLPKVIENMLRCSNPNCISHPSKELRASKFNLLNESPLTLECNYCESRMGREKLIFINTL